ncbi:hypothetical protein ABBQ32_007791 [Trebouxia sp. C0010 RCD-2024]
MIANRGEISRRVIRSAQSLDIPTIVVFTEPDALSLHVRDGDEAVCLGASPKEYTNAAKLLEVMKSTKCNAVHPGYGFLSESADFVEMCEEAGIAFLGPRAETMRLFSRKHDARAFAQDAKVPILAGSGLLNSVEEAQAEADKVGYPVLLKATGGGGGIGIYICLSKKDLVENFEAAGRQGKANFGDAGVFVEKYVQRARHIEVQIFGDGKGNMVTFVERECSIQRRHQKIVEETPSPYVESVGPGLREELAAAAHRLGAAAKYRSAGTVEFLVDDDTAKFYFLEVNTRLQVEHGITEMVNRLDLVAWQLKLQCPGLEADSLVDFKPEHKGHAIECRINAEDPFRSFAPSAGTLGLVEWPECSAETGVRVDSWIERGTTISPHYDSLLAKLMVFAQDRPAAVQKMSAALAETQVMGVPSNKDYLSCVLADPRFAQGETTTSFLKELNFSPHGIEVVDPGMNTTVQDWPGRTKLWHIGVPPSGPMDSFAFRLANALVGNDPSAAGLEITLSGPTLHFHTDLVVAITGAAFQVTLDGKPLPLWQSFKAPKGSRLAIGKVEGEAGCRGYIAVGGGVDVPLYLGSRSTFPGGKLGGFQGRALRAGDLLPLPLTIPSGVVDGVRVPADWIPAYSGGETPWEVEALPGPNAEPDYFTPQDISTFYSSTYKVHYNSNRLGIRMQGPRPKFARPDGGEGGSHPSNVHDHVYAIGTINFTGDMPVALMHDGPSLGGFVCPATITSSALWKMGQCRAGDGIKFKPTTLGDAYSECLKTDHMVSLIRHQALGRTQRGAKLEQQLQEVTDGVAIPKVPQTAAVLQSIEASGEHPGAIYRLAGDRYVQVEYGPMELDLNLRVRIHELEKYLANQKVEGLVETSPGVRSCMIEYDLRVLPLTSLLKTLLDAEQHLPKAGDVVLPVRVLHLPMAFNERWTHGAIQKYMRSVRSEGPYLPSNVDFLAANNGLTGGAEDVRRFLMSAAYMVLGLGDVYLGAPCAVPVDPRHRLVVPKYNPARTFTEEGTVGLGGAYMCIYPMDSPGGYQLVGRTLPIWNTWGRVAPFSPDAPWLLRIFDQVRFFEVSEEELEKQRSAFSNGQLRIRIEQQQFSMREYNEFASSVSEESNQMKAVQKVAVAKQVKLDEESLQRLKEAEGKDKDNKQQGKLGSSEAPTDATEVTATFTANVWEVLVKPGDEVGEGQTLVILEAMKMEYPMTAPHAGKVFEVMANASELAQQGDVLLTLGKTESPNGSAQRKEE